MTEDQIMDFEILTQEIVPSYFDTNLILYFVMEGEAKVSVNGVDTRLREKDFMLVNACQFHAYRALSHALAARFVISVLALSRYYHIHHMEFQCNSTTGESEQHALLRELLEACMENYYGKTAGDGKSLLRLNSIYYRILEKLVTCFARYVPNGSRPGVDMDEERMNVIAGYIYANYKQQISLTDLSEKMLLSAPYVSRYIKRKFGKNFREYVTEVRLGYAVRELEGGDKTVARIALDNGFPNIASFNRAFKERYHVTPKVYQEQHSYREKKQKERREYKGDIAYRLVDYLNRRKEPISEKQAYSETVAVDAKSYQYLPNIWNQMINLGKAMFLLKEEMQKQVMFLKGRLGIEYVRLWDIFDEDFLPGMGEKGGWDFFQVDRVLDFLVHHQMHPYLVLGADAGPEPGNGGLLSMDKSLSAQDISGYQRLLEEAMGHFVSRYGLQEVSRWYFEQWCDPRLFLAGSPEKFFLAFEAAYGSIKRWSPEIKVGGVYDRFYESIDYRRLISEWSVRNVQPDFISLYCFETLPRKVAKGQEELSVYLPDSMLHGLMECKQFMQEWGMNVPLHISAWNLLPAGKHVLNDSCFKGAYVMKSLMQLYPEVEMAGYWPGADAFAGGQNVQRPLEGDGGLISHRGICKPAFYAMEFLKSLKPCLLGKTGNLIVTMDGQDSYVIVCHNYKHLGIQYYASGRKKLKIERIPLIFDDETALRICISIDHVKNGSYCVKMRSISCKNGSAQDEWLKMGLMDQLDEQDVEYLRRISTPRVTMYGYQVDNHRIKVNLTLDPHEIQSVQIYRRR